MPVTVNYGKATSDYTSLSSYSACAEKNLPRVRRQFDHFGNLKQWWNTEALQRFQTKADCMISQYGDYIMADIDMKVNGINTQGENIADNGGVKQAFRAYRSWVARNGEEPLLPGLNLTHEQLFFLNYAQIWCGVMRPEAAVNIIRTGAHSPGRFRYFDLKYTFAF
ncbi:neprilysin-1 [Trichonephila clavipes]|nr:neprilysin-1 [Trichonephila clavipes]